MTATGRQPLVPTLSDGVVTLRGYATSDTDDVIAYASDPEVQRWTALPSPYTRRDAESFLANGADAWRRGADRSFALEVGGRWAGGLDIRPKTGRIAEVGFGLTAWARGAGTMTRALRLALPWAFSTLDLSLVQWEAHVGNWASRRVAWATGFQVEGQLSAFLDDRGRRADAWYGVLHRDEPMHPGRPWFDPVTLRAESVLLRAHRNDDVPRMTEALSDPRSQHWQSHLPSPYTEKDTREHLLRLRTDAAAGRRMSWVVADPDDDRVLGEVGVFLHDTSGHQNEIGYWTHPDARGRGLMTQAVRLAVRHALLPEEEGGMGLARIVLRASEQNHASRWVAEQAGFTRSGVDRSGHRFRDGTVTDDIRYDLLASELPPVR